MKKARGDLTQGSLLRHLLRLAGPIIFSYILQDAFNIIDMIFVGRLGPGAIAAVGVSGNLLRLIGVFLARYLNRLRDHGGTVFRGKTPRTG